MPESGDNIAKSEKRALVDDLLLKGMPSRRIARYMLEVHSTHFSDRSIAAYRANFFSKENGLVHQIIKASQDLADREPPATSDRETLAGFFSFGRTNDDLKMLYDRIRQVKEYADRYPFDDSYDNRLATLLGKAEDIRNRVFRHQYEHMRKAVVLNIGKKVCLAAINVFLPYVPSDKRKDVVERFEALVKPMLGLTGIPDEPEDISAIRDTDEPPEGAPTDAPPQ